ncbi:MAG TPA: histidine phosphatase family protein [Rhodopila sp.]|uniref:histidine phosphatase family protein n=1 Tax=Rhodopila sp. TaxID=2480087 RepID=UPI002B9F201A|nr:histidine phosphatase family protein [Rhodopila sp.]HVY16506.1 histidine phosphatase family protein [Rhodopila sp.]
MIVSPATTLTPISFWFLRHGETDWNAQNLSQGNVDIPLNQTGLAQAKSAALLLRGKGIKSIVASPLSRAKITAEITGAEIGLPVEIDPDLRECAYGVMEGKPMTEWFTAWVEEKLTPEGAESFGDLKRRAVAAVNRSIVRPGPVLVVAHGALFRALRAVMGHEPNVRTRNAVPVWCEPPAAGADRWGVEYAE